VVSIAVAAAGIAEQEDLRRMAIGELSMVIPPVVEAIAGEFAGVVAQSENRSRSRGS
jgi:hypothetical protein